MRCVQSRIAWCFFYVRILNSLCLFTRERSDRREGEEGRKKEYYKGEEVKGERCALIFNARRMAKFHGVIKKVVGSLPSDKLYGAMEHCVLCQALRLRDLCEGGAADRRGYVKDCKRGVMVE